MITPFKHLLLLVLVVSPLCVFTQNALHFDGSNDYVQTNFDGITGTSARTVEAWIRTPYQSNQEVVTDWGSMSTGQRFTLNLINGRIRTEIGGQGVTGNILIADQQWHHVAVTFDNSATLKYKLYVDGSLDTAYNLNVSINTSSSTNMRIGVRMDGANYFTGNIDEVRVWNYARTESEIDSTKNMEFCAKPSGLVAYYKLNQGIAGGSNTGLTTANDEIPNQSGSLSGFALSGSTSNWVTGYPLNVGYTADTISASLCTGSYTSPSGNYTWTTSSIYMDTIANSFGCDSVITIDLGVGAPTTSTISISACSSYVSPSGNYTWTLSGTYIDTVLNSTGCDSVITVQLDIENTAASIAAEACESYTSPSGNYTWNFSGTYTDTLTNAAGCDSILTINLAIHLPTSAFITDSGCVSYTSPSGLYAWTESGIYNDTIANANGCDSTLIIDLTVKSVETSVNVIGTTITCSAQGATFQWLDCDDDFAVIDGKTGPSFTPSSTGNYAVAVTQNGCTDTSECKKVTLPVGADESWAPGGLRIFPNPARDHVFIETSTDRTLSLEVRNVQGQLIHARTINGRGLTPIDLPSASGVVFLHIRSVDFPTAVRCLVIENR